MVDSGKDKMFSKLIALLNEHDNMPVKFVDCYKDDCEMCNEIRNIATAINKNERKPANKPRADVTARRTKVVEYAARGLNNPQIAQKLGIELYTVVNDKRRAKDLELRKKGERYSENY